MNRFSLVGCISILVPSLLASWLVEPAQAQNTLRWKFEQGQSLRMELNQTLETETAIAAKPVRTSVAVTLGLLWNIGEVDNTGGATIAQSIEFLSLRMSVPPGEVLEFDSRSDVRPTRAVKELADKLRPLVGAKFTAKLDARGRVTDVVIPAETKTALEGGEKKGDARPIFTAARLEQLLRQATAVLPEAPVKPGDSWSESTTVASSLGELKQITTFTYTGEVTEGADAFDAVKIVGKLELPKPPTDPASLAIKEQSLTGSYQFHRATGRVTALEIKQVLKTESKQRETTITGSSINSLRAKVTTAK